MKIYSGVTAQPEFPAVDLTERNAESLELLLANKAVVAEGHQIADQSSWAFRIGHPAVVEGGSHFVDSEGAKIAAIEHGVMIFEAMTVAVNGLRVTQDIQAVQQAALSTYGGRRGDNTLRVLTSRERFQEEMPIASEVINSTSARFVGRLTDYAVLGAALEREIALSKATLDYGDK